jgi:hypothetical protein
MRCMPTPTASPHSCRGGFLVTVIATDNAAVPRSHTLSSLRLSQPPGGWPAYKRVSWEFVPPSTTTNSLSCYVVVDARHIGKILPGCGAYAGLSPVHWCDTDHSARNQIIGSRFDDWARFRGDVFVNPPDEFRKHAAECMRMAASTRDAKEKAAWAGLARRWAACATVSEAHYAVARQPKGAAAAQRGSPASARL